MAPESPRRCGLGEAPVDASRRRRWVEVRGWQGFSGAITTGGFSFLRKSESRGNMQHENKKEDTKEVWQPRRDVGKKICVG